MINFGFDKIAQEGIIEQNTPETSTTEEEKETIITCLSDCIYCQNPEKTCMLNNVTISSQEGGSFMCGQYQANDQAPAGSGVAAPEAAQQETQAPIVTAPAAKAPEAAQEMGLSKVKKEVPVTPKEQPKDIGLSKVKKPIAQGV